MSQVFLQIRSADETEERVIDGVLKYPTDMDGDGTAFPAWVRALTPQEIVDCLKTLDPDDLTDVITLLVNDDQEAAPR